jgi:hypothetical protein
MLSRKELYFLDGMSELLKRAYNDKLLPYNSRIDIDEDKKQQIIDLLENLAEQRPAEFYSILQETEYRIKSESLYLLRKIISEYEVLLSDSVGRSLGREMHPIFLTNYTLCQQIRKKLSKT